MIDNTRAVGTRVSELVRDTVLVQGEQYYGEANVVGRTYQAAYQPIRNAQNEIIGIFYVGAPQGLIDVIISSFIQHFVWLMIIAILIAVVVMLLFIRRMSLRIGRISSALQRAGTGDFTITIQDSIRDEIGDLVFSFNQMKTSLQGLIRHGFESATKVVASTNTIKEITQQTAAESKQIARAIEEVARGAEVQTQSSNENLTAMEEVSVGVQRIAESATEIARTTNTNSHHVAAATTVQLTGIDEISLSAAALAQTSEELQQSLGRFKV